MKLLQIEFFPVYGLVFGFHYKDSVLDGYEGEDEEEVECLFQIMFFVFGISIIWWRKDE